MARLTSKARRKLKPGQFALPGGRYPINDASHQEVVPYQRR